MPSAFHTPLIEFAVEVQRRSSARAEVSPDEPVRAALTTLSIDGIRIHRAVGVLVDAGWAAEASPLLRTALDICVSILAIVRSSDPEIAAFRYMYSGFRRHNRDMRLPKPSRERIFGQIRSNVARLSPEKKALALRVLKERDRPYWFGAEFASPTDILTQFSDPGLSWVYRNLSGAAHGSFFGLRLYRQSPDSREIEPEERGTRALAVDMTSCRFLLEHLELRNTHERLGLDTALSAFRVQMHAAARDAGLFGEGDAAR